MSGDDVRPTVRVRVVNGWIKKTLEIDVRGVGWVEETDGEWHKSRSYNYHLDIGPVGRCNLVGSSKFLRHAIVLEVGGRVGQNSPPQ